MIPLPGCSKADIIRRHSTDDKRWAPRAERESLKAFLSRTDDGSVRLAYRRNPETMLRRCVIAGSTNDPHCLPADPSGNRRFVTVTIERGEGGPAGVQAYLDANRGQLWAEALHRYRAGETAWLPAALTEAQTAANRSAVQVDESLEDAVLEFFERWPEGEWFRMADAKEAIRSQHKGGDMPTDRLKAVLTGTLAPAEPDSWWPALVEGGTRGSTWVGLLQGRAARWSHWREILRVNPLARHHRETAAVLREERDEALADSRLEGAFKSYRLNLPSGDEASMLLTVEDWQRVLARPVPERCGRPIVAVDLGAGRAWSAAVGIWRSGRVEAIAVAPGIPSLEAQEKRDRVPRGAYRLLALNGSLRIAEGLRVQPPGDLVKAVRGEWGRPEVIVCDRFRLGELQDCVNGTPLVPRVSRWSEASADIRATRKAAKDGPLSCAESSRALLTASLAATVVKPDDAGNVRLVKKGTNNAGRDDVGAALVLGCGALSRAPKPRRRRSALAG